MAVSWLALLALAATALGASISPAEKPEAREEWSSCGRVWVTVHSPERRTSGGRIEDAVELNWDFTGCLNVPRRIGLFSSRPSSWNNALATYSIVGTIGYQVTDVPLGAASLPGGWNSAAGSKGRHCLWPWAGAGDDQAFQAYNCLKIQPTWMEDNARNINRLRIGELALPGTHNAGSWKYDTELNTASRDSFVLCQDRSIWAQLVHGIRYFDFRIAHYDFYLKEDDRYWLNHNLVRIRPLVPLLKEIRKFLDSTKEVIFLDFHHFPVGFEDSNGRPNIQLHNGLLRIIQRELGPHLASFTDFGTGIGTKGPTLQRLIDANRRLVFSYVESSIVAQNNWLWPNVAHLWADTNRPSDLFRYLDQAIANAPNPNARTPMHSAMAQTTPSVLDILLLNGSLRENADKVNREVSARFANLWRRNANIVSTDFFLGNDVTDISIAINLERSRQL